MNREPLAFVIPAMPPHRTAQAGRGVFVRNGRVHFFKKSAQAREERNVVALVLEALPDGFRPFEGALEVRLRLVWPYRRTEKRRVVASGVEVWHDVRPDLDNLSKGILDALTTARVWKDDGQVARLVLEKRWGPAAYWGCEVRELPGEAGNGNAQMALGLEVAG